MSSYDQKAKSKSSKKLFTSIALNKGSTSSSHNDDDEVYYPKLDIGQNSTSVDTLWMVGFLHHDKKSKERKAARDLDQMIQLPGSSVLPKAAKSLSQGRTTASKKNRNSSFYDKGSMTEAERQRLQEAEKRLQPQNKKVGIKKNSPYRITNARLKKVRKSKRLDPDRFQIRSKLLENYFIINRNELEAAICIQNSWRRITAIRYLHRLSIQKMSAIIIQAAIRSMLTRCWLRKWKKKRAYFIVRCQAHLRRRIDHRRWTDKRKGEYFSARCIQGLIRIYLSKCEVTLRKRIQSSNTIKAYFHGHKARKTYKMMRKSHYATKIQAFLRVQLSKRIYEKLSTSKFYSAREIQRCWKGYLSRNLRSILLRDRYIKSCQDQIHMFLADIEYYASSLQNSDIINSDRSDNYTKEEIDCKSGIRKMEMKMNELQKTLAQLTPRSVQQGWKEQLEKSLYSGNAMLTKKKISLVFGTRKKAMVEKMSFEKHLKKRKDLSRKVELIQQWNNDLTFLLYSDRQQLQRVESMSQQRQIIADEKRRWAVKHKVSSGKPFKQNSSKQSQELNEESREQRLTNLLKMQTYFTQLSQLDDAMKPTNKLISVCQQLN